ncbi:hypothetical protein BD413DRAFT_206784 [Trametes elegans]|nr:hypothetical protein BD413DRAFT_206784 [Trametes elegans]
MPRARTRPPNRPEPVCTRAEEPCRPRLSPTFWANLIHPPTVSAQRCVELSWRRIPECLTDWIILELPRPPPSALRPPLSALRPLPPAPRPPGPDPSGPSGRGTGTALHRVNLSTLLRRQLPPPGLLAATERLSCSFYCPTHRTGPRPHHKPVQSPPRARPSRGLIGRLLRASVRAGPRPVHLPPADPSRLSIRTTFRTSNDPEWRRRASAAGHPRRPSTAQLRPSASHPRSSHTCRPSPRRPGAAERPVLILACCTPAAPLHGQPVLSSNLGPGRVSVGNPLARAPSFSLSPYTLAPSACDTPAYSTVHPTRSSFSAKQSSCADSHPHPL